MELTYCRDNTHGKGLGTCLLHWGHRFQVEDNQPCEISCICFMYEITNGVAAGQVDLGIRGQSLLNSKSWAVIGQ